MGWQEIEKVWLACAIDTDGWIGIAKTPYGLTPRVRIYNTHLGFIQYAAELLHRKIKTDIRVTNHPNGSKKPCYRVDISGKPCVNILKAILPYLIIKKEIAEEAIELEPNLYTRTEHILYVNMVITPMRKRDKKGRFIKESG